VLGARERVEVAWARGWPAPKWLATGQAPTGGAWVVQEFNLANTIATPGRLWVLDVEALGTGPRAYDLAEALLVGVGHGHVTESAAARL
jgi:hypothetical protein